MELKGSYDTGSILCRCYRRKPLSMSNFRCVDYAKLVSNVALTNQAC